MQLLLNKGADVNVQDGDHRTAVELAASRGCYEMMELLLSHGFELARTDHQGRSVLLRASGRGDTKLVKKLLSLNADAGALDKQGRNCLHHAATSGQTPIVDRILREGIDVNSSDRDGWTPLHWAAKGRPYGREDEEQGVLIVQYLLSAGADPKLNTKDGWTPHAVAVFHRQIRLLPLLVLDCDLAVEGESEMKPSHRHREVSCDGCSMVSVLSMLLLLSYSKTPQGYLRAAL